MLEHSDGFRQRFPLAGDEHVLRSIAPGVIGSDRESAAIEPPETVSLPEQGDGLAFGDTHGETVGEFLRESHPRDPGNGLEPRRDRREIERDKVSRLPRRERLEDFLGAGARVARDLEFREREERSSEEAGETGAGRHERRRDQEHPAGASALALPRGGLAAAQERGLATQ